MPTGSKRSGGADRQVSTGLYVNRRPEGGQRANAPAVQTFHVTFILQKYVIPP